MSKLEALLVAVISGVIVSIVVAIGRYCWSNKHVRSALIHLTVQIAALSLLWFNDRFRWSLWVIVLATIIYLIPPVTSFLKKAPSSINRYEIVVDLVAPILICVFMLGCFIPSYFYTPKFKIIADFIQSKEDTSKTNHLETAQSSAHTDGKPNQDVSPK